MIVFFQEAIVRDYFTALQILPTVLESAIVTTACDYIHFCSRAISLFHRDGKRLLFLRVG